MSQEEGGEAILLEAAIIQGFFITSEVNFQKVNIGIRTYKREKHATGMATKLKVADRSCQNMNDL